MPSRDLILALTADEEVYGDEDGVDWLLKHHRELIDAEYSLNADCCDFLTRKGIPYNIAVSAPGHSHGNWSSPACNGS